MSDWYGDLTGASGDQASPSPYSGTPFGGYGTQTGTPSPSFPVASPGSAEASPLGFGGTPATPTTPALPFGTSIPGFGGTPSSGSSFLGGGSPLTSGLENIAGSALGSYLESLFSGSGSSGLSGLFGGALGSAGSSAAGSGLGSAFSAGGGGLTGGITAILPILGQLLTSETGGAKPGRQNAITNFSTELGFGWLDRLTENLGIPTIADLIGLNKNVKPEGAVGVLEGSKNPLEQMLGQFIQNYGINQGKDLSEPNGQGFNPAAYGDILQLLTGQHLPVEQNGEIPIGNVPGAGHMVNLYGFNTLGQIQKQQPNATELSDAQIQQIMPQLAYYANHAQGHGLDALLSKTNQLATKLSNAETY
jgi:hypothetical protein